MLNPILYMSVQYLDYSSLLEELGLTPSISAQNNFSIGRTVWYKKHLSPCVVVVPVIHS